MLKINARGLQLIKDFESCRLTPYFCTGGKLTIGWGHTGPDVKAGMRISQGEADELLIEDLEERENELNRVLAGVPTTSDQFSALMSLVFNIGFGDPNRVPPIPGLKTSTVLKRHKLGNHLGASRAFAMWNRSGGKITPGLIRRREAEAKLYRGER